MADYDLVPVSWDSNDLNDATYSSGFVPGDEWGLPTVEPISVPRDGDWPLVSGITRPQKTITLKIEIIATSGVRAARDNLLSWFDPEDETEKQLVVEDEDGTNDRYVEAICRSFQPYPVSGVAHQKTFLATLVVHGDVRWRHSSLTTESDWNITASGQTVVVNNTGTADAHPTLEITPTGAKSQGQPYKKFIPIQWLSDNPAHFYPVKIGDIDTRIASTNFALANGDDLEAWVDGKQTDRWFGSGPNTATTTLWINMDFESQVEITLGTAIGAGALSSIDVGEAVYDLPDSGILQIGNELFVYTDRDLAEETVTGITRDAFDSTPSTYSIGTDVYWIQHEIWIMYGDSTASTYVYRDTAQAPIFELDTSTNTQWDYEEFWDWAGKASGAWEHTDPIQVAYQPVGCYTHSHRTLVPPSDSEILGAYIEHVDYEDKVGWWIHLPVYIINAAWGIGASGEIRADDASSFDAKLQFMDAEYGTIFDQRKFTDADIAVADTWYTWTQAFDATNWDVSGYPAAWVSMGVYDTAGEIEVPDVSLKLSASNTPSVDVTSCPEMGNYEMAANITNQTTGDKFRVEFIMALNETLTINTYAETVVYGLDSSRQYQAITPFTVRKWWLPLQPGNNTIKFDSPLTGNTTIVIKYRKRWY